MKKKKEILETRAAWFALHLLVKKQCGVLRSEIERALVKRKIRGDFLKDILSKAREEGLVRFPSNIKYVEITPKGTEFVAKNFSKHHVAEDLFDPALLPLMGTVGVTYLCKCWPALLEWGDSRVPREEGGEPNWAGIMAAFIEHHLNLSSEK